ncbi:MAG: hypothetical protein BMS9Abin34_466 [Patescibacteria group bacterium]|nr:MAG: hypothetical protein BMS9Abin34_466 [Patescibacteria group bacterium]
MMDKIAVFLAQYLIILSVLIVPYLWVRRERHDLIRIAISTLVAYAAVEMLKTLAAAPRPFVAESFTPLINMSAAEFYGSFPSGHVTFLAALGTAVLFTEKVPGLIMLVIAGLVGWGRVLVGVHYPVDVLGGFLIGIITAGLFKIIHDRFPVW